MARMRICVGAAHAPRCHHEPYMTQGVERFLAHPRTRDALALCLARMEHPMLDPQVEAIAILTELAKGIELLDGCDAPNVEAITDGDADVLGEVASWLTSTMSGTETR